MPPNKAGKKTWVAEQLKKNGHLECAICSSKEVEKSLMAPRITSDSARKNKTLISAQSALEKEIIALKEYCLDREKKGTLDALDAWRRFQGYTLNLSLNPQQTLKND